MAKIKRTRFVVEGSGMFPYDMLRYDACWPQYEADAPKLAVDWAGSVRQVTLLSDWHAAPTVDRWQSFTWRVISVERRV